MSERSIPAPLVDPVTQPFWEACRAGRLMVGLCRDTGRHFFPPKGCSPFTLSGNVDLVPSKGLGTVYTFSVLRLAAPYAPAMVQLEEGPRLFTNIVDCDFAEIRIGMRVRVVFRATEGDGPPVPMFAPA